MKIKTSVLKRLPAPGTLAQITVVKDMDNVSTTVIVWCWVERQIERMGAFDITTGDYIGEW
jgi:hypothetical protein